MKRLTLALLLATSFAVTLIVTPLLSRDFSVDNSSTPSPNPTAVIKNTEPKTTQQGYIVGVFEGKIAVFTSDGGLYEVYDVPISTLPEYDRLQLQKGVLVKDSNSLRSLIEDYTS